MFQLRKQEGAARRGEFTCTHGTVQTPVFMNVATQGAIKGALSAADLELHIVLVIEHFEINGLENLVGEFGEGNPCFQTGSHHFLGQHGIDIEQLAIITKEFQKGNFGKPVIVVHHGEAIFAEKFLHLGCEAFRIMLDGLLGLEHPFCLPA